MNASSMTRKTLVRDSVVNLKQIALPLSYEGELIKGGQSPQNKLGIYFKWVQHQ